jgi:Resolvase, N terminal domain
MKRSKSGRAVFYHRDSGGRHQMTPRQYIVWAQGKSRELGVRFSGTAEQIEAMVRDDRAVAGDIFFDYCVEGDELSRPALDALLAEVKCDPTISHVLIPRRDRLARPNNPLDGLNIEKSFRELGITLVFTDKILPPLARGERPKIEEQIVGLVDYNAAGEENWKLSDKILKAQLTLAEAGHSTGGRPPDGFERWLVKLDSTKIRKLMDGERVRLAGHHVVWLPTNEERLQIGFRILDMLEQLPASRVAAILTAEGISSPDAGRYRKDNGVRHLVSGDWHATTVINIARNPLLLAMKTYGRRSMGKLFRFTPEGPRLLSEDGDYRRDGGRKVIQNESPLSAGAHFEPIVDPDRHQRLLAILDQRAGSQKGKPRSRDPNQNPLGARIFDIECCWPMYRTTCGKGYEYKCGLYQQSHGQHCHSNRVSGPVATQFVLSCIRQHILPPRLVSRLEARLREVAGREAPVHKQSKASKGQEIELAKLAKDLEDAKRLHDLARDESQRAGIAALVKDLQDRHDALQNEIAAACITPGPVLDRDTEVAKAMALVRHMDQLAADAESLPSVTKLFNIVNARLFLKFELVRPKKRIKSRVSGGIITFGTHTAPIEIYSGPTARKNVKESLAAMDVANRENGDGRHPGQVDAGREGNSIGNVNRGERI